MIQAYTVEQIRAAEAVALARDGDGTLMRRASWAVALEVADRVPAPHPGRQVVLLVGSGNNGGDALYAGVFLRSRGMRITAVLTDPAKAHAAGLGALRRAGARVLVHDDPGVKDVLAQADVILDGVVGLSAKPPLRQRAAELVGKANGTDALRVAVDLPSGIEPDSGRVRGVAFLADVTVTFGAIKTGLLIADEQVGTIVSVPIGMDLSSAAGRPDRDDRRDPAATAARSRARARTSSPAAWSASWPDRPATPERRCSASAARSAPGREWSATPARRPRPCWPAGPKWWPPRRPPTPARCRPGRSDPGWAPTARRSACCAGCSVRTSRCWWTPTV